MKICRSKTVAFSGHRTCKMSGGLLPFDDGQNAESLPERLEDAIRKLFDEGYDTFLCGMAEGFDLQAAEAVIRVRELSREESQERSRELSQEESGELSQEESRELSQKESGELSREESRELSQKLSSDHVSCGTDDPTRMDPGAGQLRLIAVIPHRGQAERFAEPIRERYEAVLAQADDAIVLSEGYFARCFHVRNDYLTDHASVLLCYYNGTKGGTQYTVRRALKSGLRIVNMA